MDILNKLKEILIKEEKIVFAYLYGSYAKNKHNPSSDIDIAIYLDKEMSIDEYLTLKFKLNEITKKVIDLAILNSSSTLLKYEIYRNHKVIILKNKELENRFKSKILFEFEDYKKYLEYSYEKTIERVREEVEFYG